MLRRGLSLPVNLEKGHVKEAPLSPSSVGSHDDALTPNSEKRRAAKRLYNNALRHFEHKDFAKTITLLDRSIRYFHNPVAEALRERAIQNLRYSQEQTVSLKQLQSCPTFVPSDFAVDQDNENTESTTTGRIRDIFGEIEMPSVAKSLDSTVYRTISSRSDGHIARKPPKLKRTKKLSQINRSWSYQGRPSMLSPPVFGSPGRKRVRMSLDSTFDMKNFHETLEDDGQENAHLASSFRISSDTTISNVSSWTVDTETSRARLFSPPRKQASSRILNMTAASDGDPSMPIVTDSPPFLPRKKNSGRSPFQRNDMHVEPLLEETEDKHFRSLRAMSQQSETVFATACSPMREIGRPQFTESPPHLKASVRSSRLYTRSLENNQEQPCVLSRKRSQRETLTTTPRCVSLPMAATPTREELLIARADVDVYEHIRSCVQAGIRMIALDFDNTMLDIHTYGTWNHSLQALQHHIRPLFKSLIPALFKQGLVLSIVTFSPQVKMIKELLLMIFPGDVQLGRNTFVCGSHEAPTIIKSKPDSTITPVSKRCGGLAAETNDNWLSPNKLGKCSHIHTVCEEYFRITKNRLSPGQVLLVDDDISNVQTARTSSVPAIHFQADEERTCEETLLLDMKLRNWI